MLSFGPDDLNAPSNPHASYSFTVPANHGPAGEILVWQGEGHYWDYNCNQGPNNDGTGRYPCDQMQSSEIIDFRVNGVFVEPVRRSPPRHQSQFLLRVAAFQPQRRPEYPEYLVLGRTAPWGDDVFYRGTVCAQLPALAVSLASFEAVAQADDIFCRFWEAVSESTTLASISTAPMVDGERTVVAFLPPFQPAAVKALRMVGQRAT